MKPLAPLVASLGLMLGATAFAATPGSSGKVTPGPWLGFIYIDLDGAPGADRAIKLLPNGTWELLESSGQVGFYDVKLASGRVVGNGKLDGLPTTAFHGAKVIWKARSVATLIEGKQIPSTQQLCDGNRKLALSGNYVVPTEKDWIEYCSKRLTRP